MLKMLDTFWKMVVISIVWASLMAVILAAIDYNNRNIPPMLVECVCPPQVAK